MTLKLGRLSGWILAANLMLPAALHAQFPMGGRGKGIDNCSTIPPGAQPAPPGTYVNRFLQIQANLAEADDFVLYQHMFARGTAELGPLGRYQLDLMTRRLAKVPFPVVIATSKNDALDEARREKVVALLAARGFTDPTRVIVAYPVAEGLYGPEAFRIYNRLIGIGRGRWGQRGMGMMGGMGGGFGAGMGGFGAGMGGFGF